MTVLASAACASASLTSTWSSWGGSVSGAMESSAISPVLPASARR